MPSHTSMLRHWLRSCWIAGMWFNSTKEDLREALPAPEQCGWKRTESGTYAYDWECQTVQRRVQDTIDFLTKGCGCKTSCQSQRCKCFKNKHCCGPGCNCQNCLNVPAAHSSMEDENTDSDSQSEDEDCIETEVITDIFDEQNIFSLINW